MAVQVAEKNETRTSRAVPHGLPALDGLRGVAVLLVIWCHIRGFTFGPSTEWLLEFKAASGFLGLYLFFVLSGFLLFLPYARVFVGHGKWPSVRRFYMRRALRILPVFYAAILLLLVLARIPPTASLVPPFPRLRILATLFTLFHDIRQDTWFYILQTDTPLWSLAIEWQYYLVLPALALGLRFLHRRYGNKGVVAGLIGLMGYGLIVRAVAAASFYHFGYANVLQIPGPTGLILALLYGMNGKYLELFALGMLASLGYTAITFRSDDVWHAVRRVWTGDAGNAVRLATVVVASGLVVGLAGNLVWLHSAGLIPTPPQAYVGRWPQEASGAWAWSIAGPWALGLCLAGLLLGTLFGPAWFRRLWVWRPLRLAGLISYSLYVWHAMIQKFFDPYWTTHWGPLTSPGYVVVYLVLLLVVGIVSYRFIERPFLHVRR